jgi:lactate dehydrogenase-like 2-hydroxyacid dehydrogenase
VDRPLVFYTHTAPAEGPDRLRPTCEVRIWPGPDRPDTGALAREAREARALCYFVPDIIDEAVLEQLPQLRVLAGFGKGYDNVDVAAASARGIWVTNVPDALTDGTADLAWMLLLGLARGLRDGDDRVRSGRFSGWSTEARLGTAVSGKVLGIVGYGAIAARAAGFSMQVLHADVDAGTPLDDLLGRADFIVLALPLADATRHLIDAQRLRLIRPAAFLINIARGSVVDEVAVADALERGALGGYAADVFALEDRQYPDRPTQIDPRLLASPHTLFTPHIGTATHEDRRRLAIVQAESVLEALAGRRPSTAVNDLRL